MFTLVTILSSLRLLYFTYDEHTKQLLSAKQYSRIALLHMEILYKGSLHPRSICTGATHQSR